MLEIYLTDLQAYNEGHLVGRWIELPLSGFELAQAISEILSEGEVVCGSKNHEEHFITDWEWQDYEFKQIEEHEDIYALNDSLLELEGKSDYELKAIAFLMSENIASDFKDAISKVDDVRIFIDMSMEDLAYDLMQELYNADALPSIIANHIDYEAIARDLEMEGNYYEIGLDIYEYVG